MNQSKRAADYVYIVGHGRSGTTLLELLLAQHPDIVAVGELERFSLQFARADGKSFRGLCSCGLRPEACPMWSKVADAIEEEYGINIVKDPFGFRVSNIGREADFQYRSVRHWLQRKYSRMWRILGYGSGSQVLQHIASLSLVAEIWARNRFFVVDTVRRVTGSKIIVDSSKDPVSMVDLYRLHQENMKVIFMTRDVRGNVRSLAKHGVSASAAASEWSKTNRRVRKYLRHVASDDVTQIKYEDLCADPANEIGRLWDFLGCEQTEFSQVQRKTWHTIAGNKTRFRDLEGVRADVAWQKDLSADDLRLIHRIAGPESRVLEY